MAKLKCSRSVPFMMVTFQMVCALLVLYRNQYFYQKPIIAFAYSIIFIFAQILYLIAALKDPGYLNSSILRFSQNANQKSQMPQISMEEVEPVEHESGPKNSFMPLSDSNRNFNDGQQKVKSKQNQNTVQILEARFCMVCQIEQPIRAKHCRYCGKCVALHDHHCPWLGECVGEKNRFYFFWYLFFQQTVLIWTFFLLFNSFVSQNSILDWVIANCISGALSIMVIFFGIMVGSLLGFHSYMAVSNVTTWELLSWNKIYYLKTWPNNLGSPFSKGCRINLHQYCCEVCYLPFKKWEIPQIQVQQNIQQNSDDSTFFI